VICRYLDSLHQGRKFYPEGAGLWTSLTLEALGDGVLDAAVLMIYEARLRPEALRFAPWVDAQTLKIARALDALEARWIAHLQGPLDAGGLCVGVALGYLDFRFAEIAWRGGRPLLAEWHKGFAALPSFRATMPPPG
jgi:glutathione S-transferase